MEASQSHSPIGTNARSARQHQPRTPRRGGRFGRRNKPQDDKPTVAPIDVKEAYKKLNILQLSASLYLITNKVQDVKVMLAIKRQYEHHIDAVYTDPAHWEFICTSFKSSIEDIIKAPLPIDYSLEEVASKKKVTSIMETKLSKAKRSSLSNDVPPILAESEDCTPDQELENKMSSLDIKDEIASNDDGAAVVKKKSQPKTPRTPYRRRYRGSHYARSPSKAHKLGGNSKPVAEGAMEDKADIETDSTAMVETSNDVKVSEPPKTPSQKKFSRGRRMSPRKPSVRNKSALAESGTADNTDAEDKLVTAQAGKQKVNVKGIAAPITLSNETAVDSPVDSVKPENQSPQKKAGTKGRRQWRKKPADKDNVQSDGESLAKKRAPRGNGKRGATSTRNATSATPGTGPNAIAL